METKVQKEITTSIGSQGIFSSFMFMCNVYVEFLLLVLRKFIIIIIVFIIIVIMIIIIITLSLSLSSPWP